VLERVTAAFPQALRAAASDAEAARVGAEAPA